MAKSKIDYADWSWGIVDGCTHAKRPGCDNCYARAMADRFWGERKFSDVRIHPERLDEVIKLKSQIIFVAPLGDLFHPLVPTDFIYDVFMVMGFRAPQHKYIIFTKRPERMRDFINRYSEFSLKDNIWLGVSISTQKDADDFIPILCDTLIMKRIISAEPLLESINLRLGKMHDRFLRSSLIDGVFAGCESGAHRRKAEINWFRFLRGQCFDYGIPFYLKQMEIEGKIVHKPFLDGKQWLEYPDNRGV